MCAKMRKVSETNKPYSETSMHLIDQRTRKAIIALGKNGSDLAVAKLGNMLFNKQHLYNGEAIAALKETGNPKAINYLDKFINTESVDGWHRDMHCDRIVEAIGCIGGKNAVKPLVNAIRRQYGINSVYYVDNGPVIEAIGKTGHRSAITPLIEIVENVKHSHTDRIAAISSIKGIGGKAAVESLIKLLGGVKRVHYFKKEIIAALGEMEHPLAIKYLNKWVYGRVDG